MERLTWESCNGGFYAEPDTIEQSDFDGHVLYSGEAVNCLALLEDILEKHNREPEQLDEILTKYITIKGILSSHNIPIEQLDEALTELSALKAKIANMIETVRCEECEYYQTEICGHTLNGAYDYCSYGKKRSEE